MEVEASAGGLWLPPMLLSSMALPAGTRQCILAAAFCCQLGLASGGAQAEITVGPNDYLSAVIHATPGAIIKLESGVYTEGLPVREINGTADQPIIIEAADPSSPPEFLASPGRNTVSIVNASYVTIRNLVLDGRGLPVDAVKAERQSKFAHHITVEGLRIVGYGFDQLTIGISTKCPAWAWVIRRNVIVLAGTGMYLGNSDGKDPFIGGLIEYNLIIDPRGYGIQIKHQAVRSPDHGEPVDPQVTIIRHNVVSKYGNGSEGTLARPNLLVGHFPTSGAGKDDRYLIYGNFLYANHTEALFQGEGNVALYANVFVNPYGDAIHIQPHYDVPRNIWLFNNTVVAAGDGIVLLGNISDYLRLLQGNVVFAQRDSSRAYPGNITGAHQDAGRYLVNPRAPPGKIDLRLKTGQRGNGRKIVTRETWPDADRDFQGGPMSDGDVGAYARSAAVAWPPRISIKPPPMNRRGSIHDSVSPSGSSN